MPIELHIKSTRPTYRRAGIGFNNKTAKILQEADLDKKQIATLKADGNLLVLEKEVKAAEPDKGNKQK